MTRTAALAEPGFWCEWRLSDGKRITSCEAVTAGSAMRWTRIQLRVMSSAVQEPSLGYLWQWLNDGWLHAAAALERGEDFTLPLAAPDVALVWHARPVVLLPLVGGSPVPHREVLGGDPWQ